jgi:DNA-binding CsgD family transcriptional regulator
MLHCDAALSVGGTEHVGFGSLRPCDAVEASSLDAGCSGEPGVCWLGGAIGSSRRRARPEQRRSIGFDPVRLSTRETVELPTLWAQLCSRRSRTLASFFTEKDCCAVLELSSEGELFGEPIGQRELAVLEKVLFKRDQKVAAMELGLSASAISGTLQKTLVAFGFDCTGSKLPALVVMVAYAAKGNWAVPRVARMRVVEVQGKKYQVVFVERPDRDLPKALSSAEAAVVRLLVEGLSHAEIARVRGTSRRTVANQLGASFRKLHVSGRIQLLAELVQRAAA